MGLCFHQFLVERLQSVAEQPRPSEHGHEIIITRPARHNVQMQMIRHARTRRDPEVEPEIETLRLDCRPE